MHTLNIMNLVCKIKNSLITVFLINQGGLKTPMHFLAQNIAWLVILLSHFPQTCVTIRNY